MNAPRALVGSLAIVAAVATFAVGPACAQETVKIGFSAPITGPFAENGTLHASILIVLTDTTIHSGVSSLDPAMVPPAPTVEEIVTAQNALRQARRLGLVTVQERRRRGMASLTNVVRVISREWLAWIGFKKLSTTVTDRSIRKRSGENWPPPPAPRRPGA